jgi:hypothetical protein
MRVDELRMSAVVYYAKELSRQRAIALTTKVNWRDLAEAEVEYRLAVRRYTDPFGVKA